VVRSTTVPIADRVALPVIRSPSQWPAMRRCAIGDVGRALVDHHHRRNEAPRAFAGPATSLAVDAPAAEQAHTVPVEAVRSPRVERLIDRLGRHPHLGPITKQARQQPADLLRAPAAFEVVGHDRPELAIAPELPAPVADPAAVSPTLGPVQVIRAGPGIPVPPDLPADRGRRATESGGNRTDAETPDQLVRDRDPLGLRQIPRRHRVSGTGDGGVHPHLAGAGRDRPAVPPAVTGLAVDPDDARRPGVAHALSHQGKVLVTLARQRLGSGRLPGPVMRRH
jgi:hypothetical protein